MSSHVPNVVRLGWKASCFGVLVRKDVLMTLLGWYVISMAMNNALTHVEDLILVILGRREPNLLIALQMSWKVIRINKQ
jgi:hypothetical protein